MKKRKPELDQALVKLANRGQLKKRPVRRIRKAGEAK